MSETRSSHALLPCDRCDTLVGAYDAQPVTIEPSGRYECWTQGRAAYYARQGHGTAPFLKYLCASCFKELFGLYALEDAERRARLDRASGKGDS